jgi:hypothetical protein
LDEVAAIGERNPDFRQGVCGRCYEVRCKSGVVKTDYACADCEEPLGSFVQADIAPGTLRQCASCDAHAASS